MKKILVTGGAGFIGSNFIRYMLGKYLDYKVVNLDKLTYSGRLENLSDIEGNPNYEFVQGDICDSGVVDEATRDCQVIVHFAAETHVDRSIIDSTDFIRTNIHGTQVLLTAARRYKISLFIHVSTDEVYGSRKDGSFSEEDSLKPNSPYAASKASADLLVRAYHVTYDLPAIITRSSNNFGPFQFPEKVVPLFVTNILEDKKLPLYGDGLNIRDWLYVIDHCEAIDFIIHKGKIGEIYNIGAGNEKTNLELTSTILNRLEKPQGLIEYVKDRPGHDRRYSVDCAKINNLGWSSGHNFEEAIQETIDWYRNNRAWWKNIKEKKKEYREYYKMQYGERS